MNIGGSSPRGGWGAARLFLPVVIAGMLGACTASSPAALSTRSQRSSTSPRAEPSLVAHPDPHAGFAIWPEDTPEAAARAAVGLESGADPWRVDAVTTAAEFARQKLEWPQPATGAVRDEGYGSFAVEVAREKGGPSVSIRLAKLIADRWWSVTYVQGSPPEDYSTTVRGARIELGFDDEGAASMDVEVRYGDRGLSKTLTAAGLTANLGFAPATTGHFLILYRDGTGQVFSAFGSTLPAGRFAAS